MRFSAERGITQSVFSSVFFPNILPLSLLTF